MRSRTSSPDSGAAMALVTDAMSIWMERPRLSQPDRETMENWAGDHTTADQLWGGGSPSGREDPDVMVLMDEEPG